MRPVGREVGPLLRQSLTLTDRGYIMVLGPTEYIDADAHHAIEGEPRQIRSDIVDYVNNHIEGRAVMMERWPNRKGEPHSHKFDRILEEAPVSAFLIYWPLGAKLHGLEFELGMLVQKNKYLDFPGERIYILQERGLLDDKGLAAEGEASVTEVVGMNEKGNRTRYHDDIYALGAKVRVWDTQESLLRHVSEVKLEVHDLPAWNWARVA